MRVRSLIACALVTAGLALPVAGWTQTAPAGEAIRSRGVDGFVPESHWSRFALERLALLGLIDPAESRAAWPVRRSRVAGVLSRAAAEASRRGDVSATALVDGYIARFEHDFPGDLLPLRATPSTAEAGTRLMGEDESPGASGGGTGEAVSDAGGVAWRVVAGTGVREREGVLLGGAHYWDDDAGWVYPGPVPARDDAGGFATATAELGWRSGLVLAVEASGGREADLGSAYAALAVGPVDVWIGRRALDFATSGRHGLVLSGGHTYDGAGITVPDGVRLPGPFARLGPVRGTFVLARLPRNGPVRHPAFIAARVWLAPTGALAIGMNRAAIFGGDDVPITLRTIGLMAIGLTDTAAKGSGFENQVASIDLRWRADLGGVPLSVYGEWAFDDIGGAWFAVPGLMLGATVGTVPGMPGAAIGIEHTQFAGHCCGHPPWYRHGPIAEGWTRNGQPLGHPLAGHGEEWAATVSWHHAAAGLLADARVFRRTRREENLFAPDLAGTAIGFSLLGSAYLSPRLRVNAHVEVEHPPTGWIRSGELYLELRL